MENRSLTPESPKANCGQCSEHPRKICAKPDVITERHMMKLEEFIIPASQKVLLNSVKEWKPKVTGEEVNSSSVSSSQEKNLVQAADVCDALTKMKNSLTDQLPNNPDLSLTTNQVAACDPHPVSSHDLCEGEFINDECLVRHVNNMSEIMRTELKSSEINLENEEDIVSESEGEKSVTHQHGIEREKHSKKSLILIDAFTLENDVEDQDSSGESLRLSMDENKQGEPTNVLKGNEKVQNQVESMNIHETENAANRICSATNLAANLSCSEDDSEEGSKKFGFRIRLPEERELTQCFKAVESNCHQSVTSHLADNKSINLEQDKSVQVGFSLLMDSLQVTPPVDSAVVDCDDHWTCQSMDMEVLDSGNHISSPEVISSQVFPYWTCQSADKDVLTSDDEMDDLDRSLISFANNTSRKNPVLLSLAPTNEKTEDLNKAANTPSHPTNQNIICSTQIDRNNLQDVDELSLPFIQLSPVLKDSTETCVQHKKAEVLSKESHESTQNTHHSLDDNSIDVKKATDVPDSTDEASCPLLDGSGYKLSSAADINRTLTCQHVSCNTNEHEAVRNDDIEQGEGLQKLTTNSTNSVCELTEKEEETPIQSNVKSDEKEWESGISGVCLLDEIKRNEPRKNKSGSQRKKEEERLQKLTENSTNSVCELTEKEEEEKMPSNLRRNEKGSEINEVCLPNERKMKESGRNLSGHQTKKLSKKAKTKKENGEANTLKLYNKYPRMPGWKENTKYNIKTLFNNSELCHSIKVKDKSNCGHKKKLYGINTVLEHIPETQEVRAPDAFTSGALSSRGRNISVKPVRRCRQSLKSCSVLGYSRKHVVEPSWRQQALKTGQHCISGNSKGEKWKNGENVTSHGRNVPETLLTNCITERRADSSQSGEAIAFDFADSNTLSLPKRRSKKSISCTLERSMPTSTNKRCSFSPLHNITSAKWARPGGICLDAGQCHDEDVGGASSPHAPRHTCVPSRTACDDPELSCDALPSSCEQLNVSHSDALPKSNPSQLSENCIQDLSTQHKFQELLKSNELILKEDSCLHKAMFPAEVRQFVNDYIKVDRCVN